MATLRVKFTLTKLQEDLRKTELRQIAQTHEIAAEVKNKKKTKTKTFSHSDLCRPGE